MAMSLINAFLPSTLVFSTGCFLGALTQFAWYKYKSKSYNNYFFLRKENKKCQLCVNNKIPYLCDNSFCTYDLILKIVAIINTSKKCIFVCNPFINIEEIGTALSNAFNRGVDVRVIHSSISNPTKSTLLCLASGIPFKSLDVASIMMHNKYIVADKEVLLRGSLNFSSRSLTGNYENLQVLYCPYRVSWYYDYFINLWDDAYSGHPNPEIVKKMFIPD